MLSEGRLGRRLLEGWAPVVLLPLAAWLVTFAWSRNVRHHAAQLEANKLCDTLQLGLATPVESLRAAQAFLGAVDARGTTLAQFRAFAAPLVKAHPELVAIEWFVVVPSARRALFEARVRVEQPGFEIREPTRAGDLVRAVERPRHLTLVYSEPLNPAVQGLDIAFDAQRTLPVDRAFAAHRMTLSDRYELVEDAAGVYSVVAYAPVPEAHWAAGVEDELRTGFLVALFRLDPLFRGALRALDLRQTTFEVWDDEAAPALRLLHRQGTVDVGHAFEGHVEFVDRRYRVVVSPVRQGLGPWPWVAATLTTILVLALRTALRANARARALASRVEQLGQYTIEREIAQGGMGSVYYARHALLRRPTAIKISRGGPPADFEREAQITCSLTHPNTVQVYDFGRGDGGEAYLAMEFIDGFHLEELVTRSGPVPPARTVRVLLQVAGSLAEAHERGLTHGDVKPRNVMITHRGGVPDFVKVLDFGLAGRRGQTPHDGRSFQGTPGYAAPELSQGGVAGPRADVFSLGCVAAFLLGGRPPFSPGSTITETLNRVLRDEPSPLPASLPGELRRFVDACLAKDPARRPDGMNTVTRLLRAALESCPPWSQADAEAWWRDNPPPGAPAPESHPHGFSIVLDAKDRRLRTRGRDPARAGRPQKAQGTSPTS